MKSMYRLEPGALVLFLISLVLAPPPIAADTLQARAGTSGWYAWDEAGRACVAARDDAAASCWAMAPGGRLSDIAETVGGWVATGYEHGGEETDVFVIMGSDRGLERLSTLPSRESLRGSPALVVDGARLLGAVWLEGASQPVLEVRAAEWLDGVWGPVMTVSPTGVGSQVAPGVTVLEDGRWLSLWTAFDGKDDETVWSVYDGESWSVPLPVHEDNEVPDIMPVVLSTQDGAIAAWSWFDGRDYRLRTAFFDGKAWRLEPPLDGRGAGRARLARATGAYLLSYHTVVPEEWVTVELDARGRILRRAAVESHRLETPLVESAGWGVTFRWLQADEEVPAPWLPASVEDQR